MGQPTGYCLWRFRKRWKMLAFARWWSILADLPCCMEVMNPYGDIIRVDTETGRLSMANQNQYAQNDEVDDPPSTGGDDQALPEAPEQRQEAPEQPPDVATSGSPPTSVGSAPNTADGPISVIQPNRRDRFLSSLFARVVRFLSDSDRMCGSAIAMGLFGFAASYVWSDFTCFARSGALIVAIGISLVSGAAITGMDLRSPVIKPTTGLSHLDPEGYKQASEPLPDWLPGQLEARQAAGFLGPLVSFIGTVIWGFGDLLNVPYGF